MKKRLFITSALMTAVMAASLATGTYAWYSTSTRGGIKPTTVNASQITTAPTISVSSTIPVTSTYRAVSDSSNLHLSKWNSGDSYSTYYIDANNKEIEYQRKPNEVALKAYIVSITIDKNAESGAPNDEVTYNQYVSALQGASFDVTVSATGTLKSRIHPMVAEKDASHEQLADDTTFVNRTNTTVTLPNNADFGTFASPKAVDVVYVAVRMDGKAAGQEITKDDNNSPLSATFDVLIKNPTNPETNPAA